MPSGSLGIPKDLKTPIYYYPYCSTFSLHHKKTSLGIYKYPQEYVGLNLLLSTSRAHQLHASIWVPSLLTTPPSFTKQLS